MKIFGLITRLADINPIDLILTPFSESMIFWSFFNPFFLVKEQLDKGSTASVAGFFASVPWRLADRQAARKDKIS